MYFKAVEPSSTSITGFMISICDRSQGMQTDASAGVGTLFPGGLHFTILLINICSFLVNPQAIRILSSNCPDNPTKGLPCISSSLPGASPISIIPACGLPSPKITLFLVKERSHFVQLRTLFLSDSIFCKSLSTKLIWLNYHLSPSG